jgi:hypothetical protein
LEQWQQLIQSLTTTVDTTLTALIGTMATVNTSLTTTVNTSLTASIGTMATVNTIINYNS